MAIKSGEALDDNALENSSGGWVHHDRDIGKYYSIDIDGKVLAEASTRKEIEDYNNRHNLSNRNLDDSDLWKLRHGINPFKGVKRDQRYY